MSSEKLQVLLKFDTVKDDYIYDMIHLSDDRTNLIKNALFYYMHEIEIGKVRDRHYPYTKVDMDKFTLNKEQQYTYNTQKPNSEMDVSNVPNPYYEVNVGNTQEYDEYEEEYEDEEEYEEPYEEEEEDNMDDLDF